MNLVIHAHTLKNEPLSQPITGRFDERGGTIGRSDTNTLSLPDPERHISRLHAEVWFSNGTYSIRNVGSANAIMVNGQPIAPGEGAPLSDLDEIVIGAYAMRVALNETTQARPVDLNAVDGRTVITSSATESKTSPPQARPAPPPVALGDATQGGSNTDPFADLFGAPGGASASDPFADLLGNAPPAPPSLRPTPVVAGKRAGAVSAPMPLMPLAPPPPAPAVAAPSPASDIPASFFAPSPRSQPPAAPAVSRSPAMPPAPVPAPVAAAPAPAPSFLTPTTPEPPVSNRLPDDFDPFADLSPAPAASAGLGDFMSGGHAPSAAPAPGARLPDDLGFGDLIGAPAPSSSSLDDIFGLGGSGVSSSTGADPLANFMTTGVNLKSGLPARPAENKDPLAMFGASAPPAAPLLPPDFDRTPELKGAYNPPAVQADPAPPTAPAPLPPPAPAAKPPAARMPDSSATVPRGPVAPGSESPFVRGTRSVSQMAETTMPAVRVTRPQSDDTTSSPLPLPRVPMPPTSPPGSRPHASAPTPAPLPTPAPTPTYAPSPRAASLIAAPMPGPLIPQAPAPGIAPVQPPHAAHPAAATGQHSNEALWAAFCEGAGIQMTLPQGLNPDLMRVIGEVMKHSVDGTLKLVGVRAAAKSELRAQVTTIQSRNNNPLKFSPDAGAAIEQLLQPPMRGFMVGPAAVTDVMDDLLGHAIGTMAGMRAALTGVLQRFEPKQLENKLSGNSVMDTVLPMNRRAKLWELYLQHFKRIEGDAEEDFHELFGKAFIKAYEDQLDRLDSARHPNV
ncbi:MAG: hypothetical protein RLZZ618_1035 [Pseudomonadota bacterium]